MLTVGDWSGDGHSRSDSINIECNLTVKELQAAYKAGAKKVKLDLTKDVAEDYEDCYIRADELAKLRKHGYSNDHEVSVEDTGDKDPELYRIDNYEAFADMWLFIAKVGNPKLVCKVASASASIHIGGYGLYYC